MKNKNGSRKILFILLILFIILVILIATNLKLWEHLKKKEIKLIPIIDQCSILFDTLLHSVKDESSCENYCRSECLTRDMRFYTSEFSFNQTSCNTCNCYCK